MTVIESYCTHPPCEHHGGPCEPCNDLTEIEAKIEDLQEQHLQARARRNLVHNGPFIHQIPPEIVSYIFTLAFPTSHSCDYPEEDVSQFIFDKVCHSWRELAFSTPRLWCNILVNVAEPNLPLLNHHISHSGVMPLSITTSRDIHTPSKQAISFIIEQLHRTSSLCIQGEFIPEIFAALGSPNAAPLLEEFHIYTDSDLYSSRSLQIEPPRQRRLLLKWFSFYQSCPYWTNISHLTLDNCLLGNVLPKNFASKDLKQLALKDCLIMPTEQIDCPSIEVLTLDCFDSAKFMFTKTSLPSLRNLEIKADKVHRLYPMIPDFLHRSLCQLQVLIIHNWGDDTSEGVDNGLILELIDVLKCTNALQHLTYESYESSPPSNPEPLVQRLSSERGFLPCLQTLSLRTRYIPSIDLMLNVMTAEGDLSRPVCELNLELWMILLEVGPFLRDDVLRILQLRATGKIICIRCALEWEIPELASDVVLYWKRKYGL